MTVATRTRTPSTRHTQHARSLNLVQVSGGSIVAASPSLWAAWVSPTMPFRISCPSNVEKLSSTTLLIRLPGIISLSHVYKSVPSQRLPRSYRLALRFAVATAILLLPLAHSLNSHNLVSISTYLIVLVVAVEIIGSACAHESFWWDRYKTRRCTYSARCNVLRKELEASVKAGNVIDVEEIARRGSGGKNYDLPR